jgi:LruC domain-containing protein
MRSSLKYLSLLFLTTAFIFSACQKDIEIEEKGIESMDDLIIAPTFNWETTQEITLSVGFNLPGQTIGSLSRIFVYLGNPYQGGKLLLSGSAGYDFPYTARVRVPMAATTLFLELISGNGYTQVQEVPISNHIAYTFTESPKQGMLKEVMEPDCNSGCDQQLSGSGSANITNGQTYCITDNYTGTIAIRKGTVKICGTFNGTISMGQGNNTAHLIVTGNGTATIGSLSMSKNCTITVYGSSSVTIGSIAVNQNAQVINYGTTVINSNFTPNDLVQNFGTLTINGQYNMNGNSGVLENSGTLNINSHWNVINEVTNEGTIEVDGDINFNGGSVVNSCKILSHQKINFNNVDYTSSNGYIHADIEATINGGANLILQNQSMVSTPVFVMNNNILGQGSANVIKCSTSGRINGNKLVSGAIEMLTPDGTLLNGNYPSNFQNGATLIPIASASAFIPIDACNPEGSGQPEPDDSDGDGVPDNLDDYPSDPTRAYNTWHPSAGNFGTLVYEDLWPSKGDYDLNDAVIDYQFLVVTNAQNKVVDIKPKFYLRAAGATLKNGFGFQIDNILPGAVASVSGYNLQYGYIDLAANGVENMQEFAVVIAWDNADDIIHFAGPSAMYNTLANYPIGYADTIYIDLHFETPQPQEIVGTPPYNPFLIKNMDRNIEIHLPDYPPTSLANMAFFGTLEDDSDPATGRYYKTSKNLPWGMNITEKYDYTYEMIAILYGYNHFAEWCQSSGTLYPDWYKDLPGYRNTGAIFP